MRKAIPKWSRKWDICGTCHWVFLYNCPQRKPRITLLGGLVFLMVLVIFRCCFRAARKVQRFRSQVRLGVPKSTGVESFGSFGSRPQFWQAPTGPPNASKLVLGGSKTHPGASWGEVAIGSLCQGVFSTWIGLVFARLSCQFIFRHLLHLLTPFEHWVVFHFSYSGSWTYLKSIGISYKTNCVPPHLFLKTVRASVAHS